MNARLLASALTCLLSFATAAAAQTTIRVEVDYMSNPAHSHRPAQAEIDAVVQMFAAQGIVLIVEIDDSVPELPTMSCDNPGMANFWTCSGPTSFSAYENVYRDHGVGWHYCLFIHRYDDGNGTGSSGKANSSNFFVVSLGGFANGIGTPFDRAATFAHELGHNLGLGHQAPQTPALGSGPYAPNLPSVMSYQYQLAGVKTRLECLGLVGSDHYFKDLDYSHGRMPPLQELFLSEQVGVGIHPVDWSCNDVIDAGTFTRDLDEDDKEPNWCESAGGLGIVYDYDEWSTIQDVADDPSAIRLLRDAPDYDCISAEEVMALADDPSSCYPGTQPNPTIEPNAPGKMIWVDPTNLGSQVGTGEYPYAYLDWAALFAPPHSILYLQPGTHVSSAGSGTSILLDKPLILTGPGGAVIAP